MKTALQNIAGGNRNWRRIYRVRGIFCAAAILLSLVKIPVAQAAASEIRTEVPIGQVTLSDGTIRYWIPVKIGNTSVEALLDTGTTGLRLLPGIVSGADWAEGSRDRILVGSVTEFVGKISRAMVAVGGLSASAPFQSISQVKCHPGQSDCPALHTPLAEYGIGADGLPGEGFHALIGIKMGASEIANPLAVIGARRWMVELPRPGATGPGKLVLNPDADEIADAVPIPLLRQFGARIVQALHDAVRGCLQESGSDQKACGTLTFDTGYPALDVIDGPTGLRYGAWPKNTKVELTILDATGARAVETFETGIKANASEVFFDVNGGAGTLILAGVMPYFAFDVLYDPGRNEIGLKPRATVAGLPTGRLIPSK